MNRRTFSLYLLPVTFAAFASVFPDRIHYLWSLLASLVLFLAANRIGKILIRCCVKAEAFYFPMGLGMLLFVAYACFIFTTGRTVMVILWSAAFVLALFETSILARKISLRLLAASPFLMLGFWSCMTPATFFDALVYHLGLPHQYLVQGRMEIIPFHLYSAFPPFDQVLNLMFAGISAESGIKIFSVIILFAILHCAYAYLRSADPDSTIRVELLVVPLLAIPSLWILVHLITADLLTALFFSSGVFLSLIERERRVFIGIAATLIAFSLWTKWNVLLYIPLLLILFGLRLRKAALFASVIVVLLIPLLMRNYLRMGDPLYPVFSVKLSNSLWSTEQESALQKDSFPGRARTLKSAILAPFELMSNPDEFGSASEIGILPIFVLLLYPFAARRKLGKLVIYVSICFFAWLFIFPNFRQFIPVFVLVIPILYYSWSYVARRSALITAAALILWLLTGVYQLVPVFRDLFPLIPFSQNRDQYLTANVKYFPITRHLTQGRAILVGETRSAYFKVPLIVSTAYDKSPFVELLKTTGDTESFYRALKQKQISYIVYNRPQFQRLSEKYGLWTISSQQQQILQEFVQRYTVPKLRTDGIYLLELK